MSEKYLVKTNVAGNIGDKLQFAADKLGLTFNEYVRKVLGEHAAKLPAPQKEREHAG